jgi:hypothetical protein
VKLKQTGHGFEARVTLPIVQGVPSVAPPLDDSGEAPAVWDSSGRQVLVFDLLTSTWCTLAGGGGSGTITTASPLKGNGSAGSPVTLDPTKLAGGLFVNSSNVLSAAIAADWPVATPRYYAVDAATGSDSNAGYSDVSAADAWTKPKATIAALAAIIPKNGAGRTIGIMIGVGTYTDDLSLLCTGTSGYTVMCIRGTSTVATAGATAGNWDANDVIGSGAITATGMNASGYNPTGTPTTSTVQCLKVGGAAPGFASEPALPCGARIRFDSNTATAALRNICRTIVRVSGGDTLYPASAFPAVPTASDVFYIEMPGVNAPLNPFVHGNGSLRFLGLNVNGGNVVAGGVNQTNTSSFSFCFFSPGVSNNGAGYIALLLNSLAFSSVANQSIGGCRLAGLFTMAGAAMNMQGNVVVGLATFKSMTTMNMQQEFFAGGLRIEGGAMAMGDINSASNVTIGNINGASQGGFPTRVLKSGGIGLQLIGVRGQLASIAVVSGCSIGVSVEGICELQNMAQVFGNNGAIINESGTCTDIGIQFNATNTAVGSVFGQGSTNSSTVTGANGDIRLANGKIITWTQLNATGIADRRGNRLIGPMPPTWVLPLSGFILGSAGATTSYMANTGPNAGGANLGACEFPTSMRLVSRLRFKPESNTFATNVVATLYKNGVATALTVTIPAGSTAVVSDTTAAHEVLFADGDLLAVVLSNAGDNGKTLTGMCVLEGPS